MFVVESVGKDCLTAGDEKSAAAFLVLSRQLGHDFNNVWAQIFGLVQRAKEMPGFQERDEVLGRIDVAASAGLLYSRSVIDILAGSACGTEVFDICQVVREWAYKASDILHEAMDISCLVPPHALHVRFDQRILRLIMLSLVGYALRSSEPKRWAMIGVRGVGGEKPSTNGSEDGADLMFLCKHAHYRGPSTDQFLKRVDAIRDLVLPHGCSVETAVVPNVGVNLRVRLPLSLPATSLGA
jgi:hypothetical protein